MYGLEWRTIYAVTRCLCVNFPGCEPARQCIHHLISWYDEPIHNNNTAILTPQLLVSFALLTFWWWHPARLLVPGLVLFHNSFFPGGEQLEQHIFAYKSEQPTIACIAIFYKYCFYIKHGDIVTNLTLWNPWGMSLICQNVTMWVYETWIKTQRHS